MTKENLIKSAKEISGDATTWNKRASIGKTVDGVLRIPWG